MTPDIVNSANAWYFVNGEQLQQFGYDCARKAVQEAEQVWKRQHDAMFDPMFDKQYVADIFDIDVRTIDNWIESGIICPTKIGRVVRFDGNEIARIKEKYKRKHSTH